VVHKAPFSEDAIKQAALWVDDVVYAVRHGEEAQREQPREQRCASASPPAELGHHVEGPFQPPDAAAVDITGTRRS
jgi:hypothetical protein